jgi:hypothetical protein
MSTPSRGVRPLALVLLLCALAAPAVSADPDADHPCCAGMSEPCAAEEAPCAALSATPCCSAAAPVTAWPTAQQRESGQQAAAQALGDASVVSAPASSCTTSAAEPSARTSLVRRSVVLRL